MKRILLSLIISCLFLSGIASAEMLQIKGSDTLINVVQRLAEIYMEKNPQKMIAVTGGGSGTGIAALINKRCAIANASRMMKSKEIEDAKALGVDPKRVVVAIDSLSFIVNPSNPITQLTVEQLGKIYRGDIKNWKELGGTDMPINLYGRQPNSGTYDFVKEVILKGEYSPKMKQMNGNAQILESIKSDPSSIGYVGIGYLKSEKGVTVVRVASKAGGEYVNPLNIEDVKTGKYPISRPLNQYIDGVAGGDLLEFLKFELSPEGQKIVEDEGFFAVPKEYMDLNKKAGL